jgi:hypothetical protein
MRIFVQCTAFSLLLVAVQNMTTDMSVRIATVDGISMSKTDILNI